MLPSTPPKQYHKCFIDINTYHHHHFTPLSPSDIQQPPVILRMIVLFTAIPRGTECIKSGQVPLTAFSIMLTFQLASPNTIQPCTIIGIVTTITISTYHNYNRNAPSPSTSPNHHHNIPSPSAPATTTHHHYLLTLSTSKTTASLLLPDGSLDSVISRDRVY